MRERFRAFWEWIRPFFGIPKWIETGASNPFFSVSTTLLVIFAGVSASLFTEGIRSHFFLDVPESKSSDGARYFWIFVTLAALAFWLNQAALTKRGNRARSELEEAVRRLKTLPSEVFLPTHSRCWKEASASAIACMVTVNTGKTLSRADVDQAARAVLRAVLEAAKDFDKAGQQLEYSANVMVWRDQAQGIESPNAFHVIEKSLVGPEISGYLELIPELSTNSSAAVPGTRDLSTKAVLLPIPKDPSPFLGDDGVTRIVTLPGAPTTFATGNYSVFPNLQSFFEALNKGTTLDDRVTRQVMSYFKEAEGRHIRSFASFPIMAPGSTDQLPLGVLNIHSRHEGLLEDNGLTLFAPLLEPFLTLLAVILALRGGTTASSVDSSAPNPGESTGTNK